MFQCGRRDHSERVRWKVVTLLFACKFLFLHFETLLLNTFIRHITQI